MSNLCDCILSGKQEVSYSGNLEAKIVLVGESPGYEELKAGTPFVGRSGRLLRNTLRGMGVGEDECFFANSARCMIEKEKLKQKEVTKILADCRIKLKTILHHIQPKLIVPLGAIALEQVLRMKGIKKARGNFYWSDEFGCWVIPNWHPAYILRNASEEDNFVRVFRTIKEFIDNGYEVKDTTDFEWEESDSIRDLLDGKFMRSSDDYCFQTAVDTETQGLEWWDGNSIVISYGVAESTTKGRNIILHEEVPVGEGDFDILVWRGGTKKAPDMVGVGIKRTEGYDRKIAELSELMRREDIQKFFMNQKYDMHRLEQLGLREFKSCVLDVALAAHTIDAPRYVGADLGYLLESLCGVNGAYKDDFSDNEKADMLYQLKTQRDKFNRYASFDPIATLRVGLEILKEFDRDHTTLNYYVNAAHPIETKFLYALEKNGVLIDEDAIPLVDQEIEEEMDKQIELFMQNCPPEVVKKHEKKFKLTRRTIMMDALFVHGDTSDPIDIGFGIIPAAYSPKSKAPQVNKDVLKILLDQGNVPVKAKRMIDAFQKWSEYYTLRSRYIGQLIDCIDPVTGRIYPTYSLTYTTSGRTGARRPSVQNFPKRYEGAKLIRRLIIAPQGRVLVEVDQSMSELRWTAIVADEKKMKEIFLTGGDMHLFTGANLEGHPVEIAKKHEMYSQLEREHGISKEEAKPIRQGAKAVNFGLIYLMSAYGLQSYAFQAYGVKLSNKKSNDWRNAFFELYPGIQDWHGRELQQMENTGFITTIFGRRIPIPNLYSDEVAVQKEAERFGVNALIQGPSSDFTLLGGEGILEDPEFDPEEAKLVLFIHDAIVAEVDSDKIDKYIRLFKRNMENVNTEKFGFTLPIPFEVDAEVGNDLSNMVEYSPQEN